MSDNDRAPHTQFESPYVGLVPFTEGDAPLFFGRDADSEVIIANLRASRLTLLYGPSGVGKSSVIRAGVAHRLRQRARPVDMHDTVPDFVVVYFKDWANQLDLLNELLKEVKAEMKSVLGPLFEEVPESSDLRQTLSAWTERYGLEVIIILDQFEEYLLYRQTEAGPGTFADEFPKAVNQSDLPVRFLISLREDALSKLDRFKALIPTIFDTRLPIGHLRDDDARAAVRDPVPAFNQMLPPGSEPFQIEPQLVESVLGQISGLKLRLSVSGRGAVSDQPNRLEIETPFLQLVMTRIWETETRAGSHILREQTLTSLGGVEEIIRDHLNAVMSELLPEERKVAAAVFPYLVTPVGTKIAHALKTLSNDEYTGIPESQLKPVLLELSGGRRILRPVKIQTSRGEEDGYEIFHDALGPAILGWRTRYQQQLDEVQRKEAERHAKAATAWRKLSKRLSAALLILVITILSLMVAILFVDKRNTERQLKEGASKLLAGQSISLLNEQPDLALLLSVEAYSKSPTFQARSSLLTCLAYLSPITAFLRGEELSVTSVAFNPQDKNMLASCGGVPVFEESKATDNQQPHAVILWNLATKESRHLGEHSKGINSLAFRSDGRKLASASDDTTVRLWDLKDGKVEILRHSQSVTSVAFSPDGKLLASGSRDGSVTLFDGETGSQRATLSGSGEETISLAFSPDGLTLASGKRWGSIVLSDVSADRLSVRRQLKSHTDRVTSLAFSPDGKMLVSGSSDLKIIGWDTRTGVPSPLAKGNARSIAFRPGGKELVVGMKDGIVLMNIETGDEERLPGRGAINSVAFSPDGDAFASGGSDHNVILWSLAAPQKLARPLPYDQEAGGVLVSFISDTKLAVGSWAGVSLWGVSSGEPRTSIDPKTSVYAVAVSPDRTRLAWGIDSGEVYLLNVTEGNNAADVLKRHEKRVSGLAFSSDNKTLASAGADFNIILWDVKTRQSLGELNGHKDVITTVAFSPDGKLLASGSRDNSVILWDLRTQTAVYTMIHSDRVTSLAFSPDGKTLATGSRDGITLLDIGTKQKTIVAGHNASLSSLIFRPDGKMLASLGSDGSIVLWDAGAVSVGGVIQKLGPTLRGTPFQNVSLAFSPDGRMLATGGGFGSSPVMLWTTDYESWLEIARRLANRAMTQSERNQYVEGSGKQLD
jgi:WD40 repeat protein